MLDSSVSSDIFAWVVLPLLIFLARICDVSLGTLRVIFISKGFRHIAPLIGFFEVIIWLLAIGQVMQNVGNVASYIAYGGGFAAGTFIGMAVEERLSLGNVVVRVITTHDARNLVDSLRDENFGVTTMDAEGASGAVRVVLTISRREDLPRVVALIQESQPNAFFTVEDIKSVREGVFPRRHGGTLLNWRDPHSFFRKGK